MKTAFVYALLISVTVLNHAYSAGGPTPFAGPDSIPSQQSTGFFRQKHPFRPAFLAGQPVAFPRFSQTVKWSGQHHSGNVPAKGEIRLPMSLGIVEKSLTVQAGDAVLQAGIDYIYDASGNRIQLLNPAVLRSDEPIEISYNAMRFSLKR